MLTDTIVAAPPLPDGPLAELVRQGDRDALGELYRRHGGAAYSLAARLVGRGDAEDVVHDVFLSLPARLASYEERGALGAWLRRVVARAALSRLRAEQRRGEAELLDVHAAACSRADPDLERAIAGLSATLRPVLVLHAVEGFSHREIAAMLGINVIAARVRYSRALGALRHALGGRSDD